MAKSKKMKLNVQSPSLPVTAQAEAAKEEEYLTRSDAGTIRDYAQLTSKPDRHKKAMDHIRNEHKAMSDIIGEETGNVDTGRGMQPRAKARGGRKKAARMSRSSARR
jgi:hypothetical protein